MRTRLFSIILILTLALSAISAILPGRLLAEERRIALVIGNSAYKEMPLKNPVNDANAMAEVLTKAGFEVIKRLDVNRAQMRQAIREFGSKLKRGGVGLFFYAGHGLQVDGETSLNQNR